MTGLTHDEIVDLLNAHDRGYQATVTFVAELVNVHREQAAFEATAAWSGPVIGDVAP